MTKLEAIALFGTRPIDLARALGLTKQAINSWGDPLTPHQIDRVQAHLWRTQLAEKRAKRKADKAPA